MAITMQEFLATSILKSAKDLEEAFNRIPEDKRDWSAMGDARTALDQMAECAILNGNSSNMLTERQWPEDFKMEDFTNEKAELMKDTSAALSLLHANAAKVAEIVRSLGDDDLQITVDMPWGPLTLAQIAAYPSWNMSYHEGQINYIASMLGCLK